MGKQYQTSAATASTPGLTIPAEVSVALAVGAGLQVLQTLMKESVTALAGPKGKHNPDRTAIRHGHEHGSVTLGDRGVGVQLAAAVSVPVASLGWAATMYLRGLVLVWVTSPASVMVASALPTAPALRPSSLPILVGVNSWPGRSASQAWTRARSPPGRSRCPLPLPVASMLSVVAASACSPAVPAGRSRPASPARPRGRTCCAGGCAVGCASA